MRPPIDRSRPICDFDRTVTPMVDVVFQLLIFFVLASGGRTAEQTLSTPLSPSAIASQSEANPQKKAAEIWIRLTRDAGQSRTVMELGGRRHADSHALEDDLRQVAGKAPASTVVLEVAGDVPLGDVILVDDVCRRAKLGSVNFAASPEELHPRK